MNEEENKRFVNLNYFVGSILALVCLWDIYGLKVSSWQYYYPFKISILSVYFGLAYLVSKKKISHNLAMDISCYSFYVYSYIGVRFLHSTYIFSFYEGLAVICVIYSASFLRYFTLTTFGLILAAFSIELMPEPDFIKAGHTIRVHLHIVNLIFGIITLFCYWFFNRQRRIINEMTHRFALIGRQASFLLHELKSPLARFMARNSEKENKDGDYIYSIIEGVEMLVTKKENFSYYFTHFNWAEIQSYLENEFALTCEQYKIPLQIEGFEGNGFGHKSTIKLALKNLIKNAIESVAHEPNNCSIRVNHKANVIEVSNSGPPINIEIIDKLFSPFYSEKKNEKNFGIGLYFVESVVKAHDGIIKLESKDGWNTFRINFKGI